MLTLGLVTLFLFAAQGCATFETKPQTSNIGRAGPVAPGDLSLPDKPADLSMLPTIGEPVLDVGSQSELINADMRSSTQRKIYNLLVNSGRFAVIRSGKGEVEMVASITKFSTTTTRVTNSVNVSEDFARWLKFNVNGQNPTGAVQNVRIDARSAAEVSLALFDSASGVALITSSGAAERTASDKSVQGGGMGINVAHSSQAAPEDFQSGLLEVAAHDALKKMLPKLDMLLLKRQIDSGKILKITGADKPAETFASK